MSVKTIRGKKIIFQSKSILTFSNTLLVFGEHNALNQTNAESMLSEEARVAK